MVGEIPIVGPLMEPRDICIKLADSSCQFPYGRPKTLDSEVPPVLSGNFLPVILHRSARHQLIGENQKGTARREWH